MAHVAFAAPGIDRFHLHERLARELMRRGHRVSVLCLDPVAATFWAAQELPVVAIRAARPMPHRVPTTDLAAVDCLLQGWPAEGRALAGARHHLDTLLPGIGRWFDLDPPDLLFGHRRRTASHRLLQFVARECGCRTLWTGDGLLPHTLQYDDEGIDGDAAITRRVALDYRDVPADDAFLAAALAAVLGRAAPAPLSRRPLLQPAWRLRVRDSMQLLAAGRLEAAVRAWSAWRQAGEPRPAPARQEQLPAGPFVAVLLQREDDPAVRLDAGVAPGAADLVQATRHAVRRLTPAPQVVAVLPAGGLLASEMRALRQLSDVRIELASSALDATTAAAAVVTINDRAAAVGLLAATPVLHLGRALFALPGVTHRTTLAELARTLPAALTQADQGELRARFLTTLLRDDHIWCSPDHPDHNGLSGLVMAVETTLQQRTQNGARLRYRAGPTWPLAVEPDRS